MKKVIRIITAIALLSLTSAGAAPQQGRERLDKIEQSLKDDVPHILCIDESFATAGQPTDAAFGKLAANGFRSVLNLRTAQEGVNIDAEREMV